MIMQGAHNAKFFVNTYLQNDLPTRLIAYRNEWNLDDEELPEPLKYLIHEPVAIDHWPMLITVAISMSGLERKDYSYGFRPNFDVQYAMRTYVWVKDDGAEDCTLKRDRLSTVLRSAFLDAPGLNRCAGENKVEAMIDESSIREEYSELTLIKGERMMAGAYIAYNLTLTEITGVPVLNDDASYQLLVKNAAIGQDFDEIDYEA